MWEQFGLDFLQWGMSFGDRDPVLSHDAQFTVRPDRRPVDAPGARRGLC
jgi:hypothetical protein